MADWELGDESAWLDSQQPAAVAEEEEALVYGDEDDANAGEGFAHSQRNLGEVLVFDEGDFASEASPSPVRPPKSPTARGSPDAFDYNISDDDEELETGGPSEADMVRARRLLSKGDETVAWNIPASRSAYRRSKRRSEIASGCIDDINDDGGYDEFHARGVPGNFGDVYARMPTRAEIDAANKREEAKRQEESRERLRQHKFSLVNRDRISFGSGAVANRPYPGRQFTVTASDGRRVYVRVRDKSATTSTTTYSNKGSCTTTITEATTTSNNNISGSDNASEPTTQLLSAPIAQLLGDLETARVAEAIEATAQQEDKKERQKGVGARRTLGSATNGALEEDTTSGTAGERLLWVNKYASKSYVDLISDEETNRALLMWLREWDYCVFGRPNMKPRESDAVQGAGSTKGASGVFRSNNSSGHGSNSRSGGRAPYTGASSAPSDVHHRPMPRVILLSGPPGLGKTTLAHVCAVHCGYHPVEMNASDDRAEELFRNTVVAATQMRSVTSKDTRPNCLIIDEIDGTTKACIAFLLSHIEGRTSNKKSKGGKKATGAGQLRRPIICICNDLFAPSLRSLRKVALVLQMKPTAQNVLIDRLQFICESERLSVERRALVGLAELTGNDIRSCLHTLQFMQRKHELLTSGTGQNDAVVTLEALRAVPIGRKDAGQKDLFALLNTVFSTPSGARIKGAEELESGKSGGSRTRKGTKKRIVMDVVDLVGGGADDYDRIAKGCFENYLGLTYGQFTSPLQTLVDVTEWLHLHDILTERIHRSQQFNLMRFLPFVSAAVHLHCTQAHTNMRQRAPFLRYPTSFTAAQQHQRQTESTIAMMLGLDDDGSGARDVGGGSARARIRALFTPRAFVLDCAPHFLDLLSPTLRPVNTQLYNAQEKETLEQLVNVMSMFSLTYAQKKGQESQYFYTMEPDFESAVMFPDLPNTHRKLPYVLRQYIAHALTHRRMVGSAGSGGGGGKTMVVKGAGGAGGSGLGESERQKALTASKRRIVELGTTAASMAKKVKIEPKVERDFFGRLVEATQESAVAQSDTADEDMGEDDDEQGQAPPPPTIMFKFHEGFTNAVRRTVRIRDLL